MDSIVPAFRVQVDMEALYDSSKANACKTWLLRHKLKIMSILCDGDR